MAVSTTGDFALEFDTNINVEGFINGQKIMEEGLSDIAAAAGDASKKVDESIKDMTASQTGVGRAAKEAAEQTLEAWKRNAEEIVTLARQAGVKAGEAFEYKLPSIRGVENINIISAEQLELLRTALVLLDDTLTTQEQINKTGLSEIDFLETKKGLLSQFGKELDEQSQNRLAAIEKEKQAELDLIERKKIELWDKSGPSPTGRAMPDLSEIIGKDFKAVMAEAGQAYEDLDDRTRKFISSIVEVSFKLSEVEVAQKALDDALDEGKLTTEQYTEASIKLSAQEASLKSDKEVLIRNQKESVMEVGSIDSKIVALKKLKQTYNELSEADRGSDKGKSIAEEIRKLSDELKSLEGGKENVVSVRTELSRLQELMARNPSSPLFEQWKKDAAALKSQMQEVKTELTQATNATAGIDAFAAGLQGLVGGFTAASGVVGLFTQDQKKFEEVTKNAASALALLNGVQQVSNVLAKTSKLNIFLLGLMRKANIATIAAETTAENVNTTATAANTAAQGANAAAAGTAAAAQRSLTAAMMSNPAGLVLASIAALAVAYLALSDNMSEAAANQKRLSEEQKKVGEGLNEQKAKIEPLIELVKNGNLTYSQQVEVFEKLKEINPSIVDGLDAQTLSYEKLNANLNTYLDSLEQKLRSEAKTESLKEALNNYDAANKKFLEAKANYDRVQKDLKTSDGAYIGQAATQLRSEMEDAEQSFIKAKNAVAAIRSEIAGLYKGSDAQFRLNPDYKKDTDGLLGTLNKSLSLYKELQGKVSDTSDEYKQYQKIIEDIEAQIRAITGAAIKQTSEQKKEQSELNRLLREQKSLLEAIEKMHERSVRSGNAEEETEIDRINKAYDELRKKIEEFNKKAPASLKIDLAGLELDRAFDIESSKQRKAADDYKKVLEEMREAYQNYQKAVTEVGEGKAKELYESQIKEADNYLEYLKKQKEDIEAQIPDGKKGTLAQQLNIKSLADAISAETLRITKQRVDDEIKSYARMLKAAKTFSEQRLEINNRYAKLEAEVQKDALMSDEVKQVRLQILENRKKEELDAVTEVAYRETEIYKKVNEDISEFTFERIKKQQEYFKKVLSDNAAGKLIDTQGNKLILPPEVIKSIEEYLKKLDKALEKTRRLAGMNSEEWANFANDVRAISGMFNELGSAVEDLDSSLSDALKTMGSMLAIAGDVANAFASFASGASGDIIGGLGSAVSAISKVVKLISGEEERQRERERQKLIFEGELAINALYRDRVLEQARLNKLKLEGIKAERDALSSNRRQNDEDYQAVFDKLKKLQVGVFESFWNATVLQPYLNSSYEDLERLFMTGQLPERARELFEQLQKLKEEGVDIEKQLEENKKAAQEIFTGSTSDSILDSIVEGFAQGKKATADFAGDFEKLMKQAILNSLKYQTLQKPLQEWYEQFASAAESDGALTQSEIEQLQNSYDAIIRAAGQQFEDLKQITKIDFNSADSQPNSFAGAIKGITQQQADLLAGQFGGLRMTNVDILNVNRSQLNALNVIANNTGLLVEIESYLRYLKTTGIKVL